MCLFVCVVDHGVNEGVAVDEQYCEPVIEDQFHDPEPERQCFDQDFYGFAIWCARANVAGQRREISILSCLRTELVCHIT